MYSLAKAHNITFNEVYSVLRTEHAEAIRKARLGHRFVSWEGQEGFQPTKSEIANSRQTQVFGHISNPE